MPSRPQPVVQALLLSNFVHQDPRTRGFTIHGTFNRIACDNFPVVLPPPWVYMAVTALHGPTPVQVRLVSADEDVVYHSTSMTVTADDPLVAVEAAFALQGVRVEEPGLYRLQVAADGVTVAEQRFRIARADRPAGRDVPSVG